MPTRPSPVLSTRPVVGHACRNSAPGVPLYSSFSLSLLMLMMVLACGRATAQEGKPNDLQKLEFFESRIRPVLVERCYACHNSSDTAESGLAVDHRSGLLKGGDRGKTLIPGEPEKSRLLATLRHDIAGLEMPQDAAKLNDRVIADFEKWIAEGAADPRDHPPSAKELAASTAWEAKLARRKQWWSWQPIQKWELPQIDGPRWAANPIDRFIFAKLNNEGLKPSPPAEPVVLVRRLFVSLLGLPPNREEAQRWTSRISAAPSEHRREVLEQLVDELLGRPQFGERWARHWMDWIRYAESHGSEGDPAIAGAWMYRDYLVRALNADVPIDQLIREHVAGDLLTRPRLNEELGINESAIGPAHWRMVFHGFSPTDALEEKVRFIDDQINVFSKAFVGLTVSCARCHDHKFDAISQEDYYALFGVLASCRPGRTVVDRSERVECNRDELSALKPRIRQALANDWLADIDDLRSKITDSTRPEKTDDNATALLNPLWDLKAAVANGHDFATHWDDLLRDVEKRQKKNAQRGQAVQHWKLGTDAHFQNWYTAGIGLRGNPRAAGEFSIAVDQGDSALNGIYPEGVYSHALSTKHAARLTSRDLKLGDDMELWVRVAGGSGATLRYVVQDYPRSGTIYPVTRLKNDWFWQRYDLSYWSGDQVHIELATAADAPLLVKDEPRSWFGIREAILQRKGEPRPDAAPIECLKPLFAAAEANRLESISDLDQLYVDVITDAVRGWSNGKVSNAQALLLDACLRTGLLANKLGDLQSAAPLIQQYRRREREIPIPRRVPSLEESTGSNQPLFRRGDHQSPGELVPRRFLGAIDSTPYQTSQSGRLQLVDRVLRQDNPLTRRVMVNRIWHHLFGQGIVSTPDNFGKLGAMPSHPKLLDWLALRLEDDGWSLKQMVRRIVTSQTWQQSSRASAAAQQIDPENRLLSHANVRRMEAEVIRDHLLSVAGQLNFELSGPPVGGKAPRRSVYVRIRRNALDPFLRVFDFPEPFSTVGRRDVTNVPAQSLTLLNDPRMSEYAIAWAEQILEQSTGDKRIADYRDRVRNMFWTALARPASESEIDRALQFLATTRNRMEVRQQRAAEIVEQIAEHRKGLRTLKSPIRKQLLAKLREQGDSPLRSLPQPIGRWDFEKSARDRIGAAHGQLRGGARLAEGALIVRNGGHLVTRPLEQNLRAKTLEAWVQLDNLSQRAGGVMTVQTADGEQFDSIVYGEQEPHTWLAGSNHFKRTQSFSGPPEQEASERAVHLAIVYHDDGRIVGYRNGKRYGKSYRSSGPVEFKAGKAVVSLGVRHLPAVGNRLLSGRILKAQLYDRALSAGEIAASSESITDQQVLAKLSSEQRAQAEQLEKAIASLNKQLEALQPVPQRVDETVLWSELARAMFTFKEFIYVR